MKKLIFYLSFIPVALQCGFKPQTDEDQSVNSILGDISFIQKFGYRPDATTDEGLRIKTHLEYVEDLLRQKDVSGLPDQVQQRRKQMLDLLHEYRMAGIFPRNYDHKESRRPCFIDKDNRICAVGYLIEKTAGREVAENINREHKYDLILSMNNEAVENWIEASGLTKEECAMIQPGYGFPVPGGDDESHNYISRGYGISSSVLGGVNLSMSTLNAVQLSKGANNKTIGVLGLISGAGQTILGIAAFPKTTYGNWENATNESKKTLSMINIGLGTTTMILSAWNLISNKKREEKKFTWNINSFETPDNKLGMAFSLRKSF